MITCFNDDDCPGTQWCENSVCVGDDNTHFCNDSSDCPGDQWCRDHVCVGHSDADTDVDTDTDTDTDTGTRTDTGTDTGTGGCIDMDSDSYGVGPDCLGMDCDDQHPQANPAADEICDGLDNDCDGKTDEDLTAPPGTCLNLGVCRNSSADCINGMWQCNYPSTYEAGDERTCDGLDNDCDGKTDENLTDCTCTAGQKQPCGTDEGECEKGYQYCQNGSWGPCDGIGPKDEKCDGKDNNCNGQIDEDLETPPNPCMQKGVCEGVKVICKGSAGWQCDYPSNYEAGKEKTCDGLDNDCDGTVDEDIPGCDACKEGEERPCSSDVGMCTKGKQVCKSGVWGPCSGQEPVDEICDGKDNDCDGTVDNHLSDQPPECLADGVCSGTQPVCDNGWKCPYPGTYEKDDEKSCDGLDNDCDGQVDEGLVTTNDVCPSTKGVCAQATAVCNSKGDPVCNFPPTYEEGDEKSCDGLDNDCDGQVDENLSPGPNTCLNKGVCANHGEPVCKGAEGWDCQYPDTYEAGDEKTCDDVDNDCDGDIDEGLDKDQDGIVDCHDNCPDTPNPDQRDDNENQIGDACEVSCQGATRVFSGTHVEDDTTGKGDEYNGKTTTDWLGGYTGGCRPDGYNELGNMNGPDLVYEVEVHGGQTLKVTATPTTNWDMGLYIITDCGDSTGDTCQLWSDKDGAESIEGVVQTDSRLLIVVDGYRGASGPFTMDVQITDPPEGETCSSPIRMDIGKVYTGNTTNFRDDAGQTCSKDGAPGPDIFYEWTVPKDGDYLAAAVPSSWDLSLYIFQDCSDIKNSCIGGADSSGTGGIEFMRINANSGEKGFLAVDGYGSSSYGTFATTVLDIQAQTQENCSTAEPIGIGDVKIGDTKAAAKDHNVCKSAPGPDHVYAYTAQSTEQIRINAVPDSSWDLVLYSFSDCSDPSGSCEKGSDSGDVGQKESMTITVQQGKTYYIVVDSYNSNHGGVYALQVVKP
ncbi:MAG: hypothetical protein GXP49_07530 [Deltaproteobacteria bacterium]|nr:hypothetical protein [Deltaproteobacteria bacterium]